MISHLFFLMNKKQQPPLSPGDYRNAANAERTFIMLKPDAIQRGLAGAVIQRFEARSATSTS
jgi:hypothetical protein